MKCSNCECDIVINPKNNEKNVGILKENKYVCIPCDDVLLFISDNKEKVIIKETTIVKEDKIILSQICCFKCNKPYEDNKCKECNLINPLIIRQNKKKKKK
jgi:hypothetical protein